MRYIENKAEVQADRFAARQQLKIALSLLEAVTSFACHQSSCAKSGSLNYENECDCDLGRAEKFLKEMKR